MRIAVLILVARTDQLHIHFEMKGASEGAPFISKHNLC